MQMGQGGTTPSMGMLGENFTDAQVVMTGVLGPGSNESLHLQTTMNLTGWMAKAMAIHANRAG